LKWLRNLMAGDAWVQAVKAAGGIVLFLL